MCLNRQTLAPHSSETQRRLFNPCDSSMLLDTWLGAAVRQELQKMKAELSENQEKAAGRFFVVLYSPWWFSTSPFKPILK